MFDPYHRWLGIPNNARPPTHYQLLGLANGESDPEVIDEAVIRQTTHVRSYQIGPHAAACTKLLNEIAVAKATLLNPAKKRNYDESLARQQSAAATAITAGPAPNRGSSLDELSMRDEPVISITRTVKPRRGNRVVYWLVGGILAAMLPVGVIHIGVLPGLRQRPVEVAQGDADKQKEAIDNVGPEAKNVEPPIDIPDAVVVTKKIGPPAEPLAKKLEPVPPEKKTGDQPPEKKKNSPTNFPILLHKQVCSSVAFPADRSLAATATNPVRILDAKTYRVVASITDAQNRLTAVRRVAFTRDGAMLLIACGNHGALIAVYDVATRNLRFLKRSVEIPGDYLVAAALSFDGRYAASTHLKGRVFVYDVAAASELRVLNPGGKQLDCAFLSDQHTLLTAGEDGALRLWDVETGTLKKQYESGEHTPNLPRAAITCVDLSADGRWVLFGYDKYLRRFDLKNEKPDRTTVVMQDTVVGVAMAPDGAYVAAVDKTGNYGIFGEVNNWTFRGKVNLTKLNGLAFGPDNESLWFASNLGVAPVPGWGPPAPKLQD